MNKSCFPKWPSIHSSVLSRLDMSNIYTRKAVGDWEIGLARKQLFLSGLNPTHKFTSQIAMTLARDIEYMEIKEKEKIMEAYDYGLRRRRKLRRLKKVIIQKEGAQLDGNRNDRIIVSMQMIASIDRRRIAEEYLDTVKNITNYLDQRISDEKRKVITKGMPHWLIEGIKSIASSHVLVRKARRVLKDYEYAKGFTYDLRYPFIFRFIAQLSCVSHEERMQHG